MRRHDDQLRIGDIVRLRNSNLATNGLYGRVRELAPGNLAVVELGHSLYGNKETVVTDKMYCVLATLFEPGDDIEYLPRKARTKVKVIHYAGGDSEPIVVLELDDTHTHGDRIVLVREPVVEVFAGSKESLAAVVAGCAA